MQLFNILVKTLDATEFDSAGQGSSIGISGCQTVDLQAVVEDVTPANKTFNNGTSEISSLTFQSLAASTAGNYVVIYDTAGLGWAVAVNKTGSSPAPTGAIWTAIASGRKANVDVSGATTAANVAALMKTAFEALTSFPFTIVDAGSGVLTVTCTLHGNTTNAAPHNADDSGAGGISASTTTPGTATSVDTAANSVTITDHGFETGEAVTLTSTGTLPAGVTTGVTYYVISLDDNTIQFASSLLNALAGTAIDLTNQGTSAGVNTIHVTALAGNLVLRGALAEAGPWFDLSPNQDITSDTEFLFELNQPGVRFIALGVDISAGSVSIVQTVLGKGLV